MATILPPRLHTPRERAPSPSRVRTRTAALLHTGSKLVKRANRESRFVHTREVSLGGASGSRESLAPLGSPGLRSSHDTGRASTGADFQGWAQEEDDDWFKTYFPPGGLEPQPYAQVSPYPLSYSHSSLNMDALNNSLLFANGLKGSLAHANTNGGAKAPRRVLDLGCGPTPFWILETAMQDGWEKTEFVGLDVAPSSVAISLPASIEDRVAFIEHDLRDRLPFQDASFDYVRMSFVNLALREQDWQELCEEAVRVLRPGKTFEIVESDHAVLRYRPDVDLDRFAAVDAFFSDVLSDRFINPRPLTVLPSTLAISGGTRLRSTGRVSLELPVALEPKPATAHPLDAPDLLSRYTAGRKSSSPALVTDETRVLLHAYADEWASSSLGLAKAAVVARRRARSVSDQTDDQKDVEAVEDLVHRWADDLRSRANVASLLTSQLGWAPAFDVALTSSLESKLATGVAGLREVETHRALHEDVFDEPDAELERRWQQLDYARREAEAELSVVRTRLAVGTAAKHEAVGTLDFEVFVVDAPVQ